MKCPTIGEVGKIVYRNSASFTSWGLHRASALAGTVALFAGMRAFGNVTGLFGNPGDVHLAGKSVQEYAESVHPAATAGVIAVSAAVLAVAAHHAAQKIDISLHQKEVVQVTKQD